MRLTRKRALVTRRRTLLGVLVLVVALAGSALAAWLITSDGQSGRGQLGNLVAPTVTHVSSVTGQDCLPGQSCAIQVSVNNPNSYALLLTAVTFMSPGSGDVQKPLGTNNSACPFAANITWAASKAGLSINVPPGTSTVTVPAVFTLSATSPTACAGSVVFLGTAANHQWTFSTP